MRLASFLTTSRHGVFYFRWPLPASAHPQHKRLCIRVSLETRCPVAAQRLSRLLVLAGQSYMTRATHRSMRYDEIKQHVQEYFRDMLTRFKEELAAEGPPGEDTLSKLEDRRRLAALDLDAFLTEQSHGGTAQGLIAAFCQKRGIAEAQLTDRSREWLVQSIHAAHAAAIKASLDHIDSLSDFDLTSPAPLVGPGATAQLPPAAPPAPGKPVSEVSAIYFAEIRRDRKSVV